MQLTRILSGASSIAMDRDNRFTAPLVELYQVSPGRGRMPAVEPMLTMAPPPAARISGTTARVMWKIDLTLMS
jgi:hypothetical protein